VNPHGGQDWLGCAIVVGSVLAAVGLDYALTRVHIAWESRQIRRTVVSVRAIAARCPSCGCQVQAGHEPGGEACLELQAERAARAVERAQGWSE
jgi:hypothetical protein